MRRRLQRLRDDEQGMTLVMAGLGLLAFMSASMFALDVGMFMVARTEAQTAADAGALSGAVALAFDDFDNKTSSGAAVQSAITAATSAANAVIKTSVSVEPSDVTFPAADRIKVQVRRSSERGNPLIPFVAPMFGIQTVNLGASAVAEAVPANRVSCITPFAIPDRWTERQTPPWDTSDTFSAYPKSPTVQPDVYHPANDAGYTGYDSQRDRGLELTLTVATSNILATGYLPLALPGSSSPDDYLSNIEHCSSAKISEFDLLTAQPGNVLAQTKEGIQALIDRDPGATWDPVKNRVLSSMSPSPRVIVVPVFDPLYFDTGKKNGKPAELKAANFIGFFIEGLQGNNVVGRVTAISGSVAGNSPAPPGSFPRAIRLVQ